MRGCSFVICLFAVFWLTSTHHAIANGPLEDAATLGESHPTMKRELLNLGPLGARGLMQRETRYPLAGYFLGTTIEVTHVFADGPAEGKLHVGDVLTGINGVPFGSKKFTPTVPEYHAKQNPQVMAEGKFQVQAYRELGHAIDLAEESGAIIVDLLRGGHALQVEMPLQKFGTHSVNWPDDDPKSNKIVADACRFLAEHQGDDGRWLGHVEPSGPAITTAVCGLALLSSGDDRYLPNVKRAVTGMMDALFSPPRGTPLYKMGLQNWHVAYACILASEYQLRTGDKTEMPRLQILCDFMLQMQLVTADKGLGGWGHGHAPHNPGPHPSASYRELNICSAQNLIALGLMKQCGIAVPDANLSAAGEYLQKAAGDSGAVDYTHWALSAGKGAAPGATGAAIVGYEVCNYRTPIREKMADWLSRHFLNAPHNHGSVMVGVLWTSLGLSLDHPRGFRQAMDELRWYFTLARGHDGSFTSIPGVEANVYKVSADRSLGRFWTTGVNTLILSAPKQSLLITGKTLPVRSAATWVPPRPAGTRLPGIPGTKPFGPCFSSPGKLVGGTRPNIQF